MHLKVSSHVVSVASLFLRITKYREIITSRTKSGGDRVVWKRAIPCLDSEREE